MIPQGPRPTVRFRNPCDGEADDRVPVFRFVEPREDGLEEHLAKMSPEGATELRSRYAMARCALDEGQWETASSSLLCCRDILQLEKTRVGELSYGLLLLWAEYPLAKMYQLRGSAEGSAQMLKKAVEIWVEILDATKEPVVDIYGFLSTALYELGCANGNSETKAQSVQVYAAVIPRESFAECELCLLLSYDYYWSGAFETSLKWIQEANRLCERPAQPPAYLRWEVYVLRKLHRFKDALSALDNLSFAQVSEGDAVGSARAKEIRCWIVDCSMQMHKSSTSDGDPQELNNNGELKELQLALEYSLVMGQATEHPNIEVATPVKRILDEMLTPDSTSVRSWLSGEHLKTIESHIEKLPYGPRAAIVLNIQELLKYVEKKKFSQAIYELESCREVLRNIKNCLDAEAYYTILASVDHCLADLYQFCENLEFQFEKALNIRKELLTCIQRVGSLDEYTEKHYMSLVILTEYQGCPREDAVSREQVVQRYASLMGMNKEQAECDMCFWIFFRDRHLRRKLNQLKDEVMPRWEDSGSNHSLSYPDLIRCEVELMLDRSTLLMQPGEDGDDNLKEIENLLKQAEDTLKGLLKRFEGQSSHEAWVHAMLQECFVKRSQCATTAGDDEGASRFQDMAATERALCLTLNKKLGLHEVHKPSAIAVSNRTQLIQVEEHVMRQYYWIRFPSAHYLAFQKLYEIGRSAQDEGDWECAILNLELCRDLLKELKIRFSSWEFDSSLAWVDLPLVQLYQMKMKNLKKSLDLRNEVRNFLHSPVVVDPYVPLAIYANLHTAMYLCGRSNYPSLLDEIMDEIVNRVPKVISEDFIRETRQISSKMKSKGSRLEMRNEILSMDEFKQTMPKSRTNAGAENPPHFWEYYINAVGRNYWEYYIVTTLLYWHFVQGHYETALDIVWLLKQVVDKHFPEDQEKKLENKVFEANCLMELNMFEDADMVFGKSVKFDKLPKRIQQFIVMCRNGISGVHATVLEAHENDALYYLRITGAYAQKLQRYEDAAHCYTWCIKIIEAAKNAPATKKSVRPDLDTISDYRGQPGWYDYFQLGKSHAKLFETKMRKNRENSSSHPHSSNVELEEGPSVQDKDFSSALFSFQQQIKLLVNPAFIARANHEILNLYATMDDSYFGYLLIKHRLMGAHAAHLNYGVADINNVKLMEGDNKPPYYTLTSTDQSILEEVEAEMIRYGRRTSIQFANSLYAMKGKYTQSWIKVLEGHKDVYATLQKHYLNKMFLKALTLMQANSSQAPGWSCESTDEYRWKAFLYAERQRSRVLLYQLGPQKFTSTGARQLWEFDTNDSHAMDTMQHYVGALEKDSVFVEYTYLQENVWVIYVVQDGKLSHYLLTLQPGEKTRMENAITRFSTFMNAKKKEEETERRKKKQSNDDRKEKPYTVVEMNQDLEYLHDLLIKPIAHHLCQMEPQHKLTLAPTELLANVTFAALRDPTRPDKEKYLVQRHTISMVPSLRAFERCNERLEILQKFDLVKENAIIALGDAVYYEPLPRIPGTGTEVEDIKRQFPHGSVIALLRDDATVEKLLHWVANPSHTSSRQVIVHIGAHGMVDKNDVRNSHIVLTDPGLESTPGGKLRTPEHEDRDEVIGGTSRMEYDEEDDELSTMNERTVRMMSDEVDKIIDRVKGKENTNDKDMNKGKVGEDLMEKYSGKEMDKGKGKVSEDLMEKYSGKEVDKGKGKVGEDLMEKYSGKEKGKGKVGEDLMEKYSGKEMDKGKGKVGEDLLEKYSGKEVDKGEGKVGEDLMEKYSGKEKGKGKVGEDLMEKYSGKEMDKGKGKVECIHEQAEPSIEEIIQWAEKRIEDVKMDFSVFVEHPELRENILNPPEKSQRNVLALQDISDSKIPWQAELVVLSACHTSEGKATAEGLVNLARAFIIAGVPCVVASQWAVPDGFTSTLMKYFYYNLRHGQDVATSLRSAMSRMIDEGCSVKAWAPFVVWGSSSLVLPKYLRCK